MDVNKKQVMLIRTQAIDLHKNQPIRMLWPNNQIMDNDEKIVIAYLQAIGRVLELDINIEYMTKRGKNVS